VYDEGLYVAQLAQLVLKFGWEDYVIVGYSMGGAITAGFGIEF
jgi:pimeloyl-ACP methyl ester carboxylesterase